MRRYLLSLMAVGLWPTLTFAQTTTQVVEYYHTDALGSVRAVTKVVNGQTQVVSRHDYKPFGEEVAPQTPPVDKRLFTGKERDQETGWDYFEARYLAGGSGRFTSPDPVGGSLCNPQTFNRYAYCLGNPLRYRDPSGLIVDWGGNKDLRKSYEARIHELLSSATTIDVARGRALEETYRRLDKSDITFHVTTKSGETDGGELIYKGSPGHLYVELRGEGSMPTTQKLAHEFKHGEQFLNSQLGFQRNSSGDWVGYRVDLVDEAGAFRAGFGAERAQLNQPSFIQDVQRWVDGSRSDLFVASQLNLHDGTGQYRGRAMRQLDISATDWPGGQIPANIYAVPRIR